MRTLLPVIAFAIILALSACDQRNGQQQSSGQQGQTAQDQSTAIDSPPQVLISAIQIDVTLDCVLEKGAAPPPDSLSSILSTITLSTADGHEIRFETMLDHKIQISVQPNGDYTLTMAFFPENPADVVGRPVTDLHTVSSLTIQIQKALANALHLSFGERPISEVAVTINGIAAVKFSPVNAVTQPNEDVPLITDVSSAFSNIEEAYRNAERN